MRGGILDVCTATKDMLQSYSSAISLIAGCEQKVLSDRAAEADENAASTSGVAPRPASYLG